ncbi:MAG: TetR/AcrR family transcriptional regulator [Bifidobacterium dentium]
MHQPQKRQTTRTPATQIQVSSQKSAESLSAHFSIELGDIRHTIPTNGMYNVGVFDSIIEGEAYGAQCAPWVTRQRILDAAKKLFAQKGYERTTIQDILDELEDLSKGAIYHHFKNKEAMLHALVDSDNERLLPQANQEDGSRNGLQKLRNSLMMQITDTEHMTLMRDAFPC